MYSPLVIERRRRAIEKHLGFLPERSSPEKIAYLKATIDSITLYDDKGNPTGFSETPPVWLQQMVRNEIEMCRLDFRYWCENYAIIRNDDAQLVHCTLLRSQEILLSEWAEMEESGLALYLIILKARQLGMCLDPKTLVLTSDMKWIPIDSIQVGQELVGTDEEPDGRGHTRKLRRTIVEAKREVIEEAFKITFHDGREIIATGQHRFLCAKSTPGHGNLWKMVSELRPGMAIRNITKTWEDGGSYEDGWFSGMLDGEGSLRAKTRAGSECCVSQVEGPVLARAETYLATRGYVYRRDVDNRKVGESSKLGNKPVVKLVLGRIDDIFKLLGQTRPSRFADRDWWVGKELPGKGPRRTEGERVCWSTVVKVEPVGRQRMIDLQTSTKTFIAAGLVSHNSTLIELAIAHRIQFYPNIKAVVASSDPRKSERMSQMMFLCWANEPWWLRPALVTNRAGVYAKFSHGSEIYIEHGSRDSGIARGTTPSIVHLSELPDWPNPSDLIDSALMRAIHPDPWKFVILESTAKGLNDWWHKKWQASKLWPRSKFKPIFLPWFVDEIYWPTPSWLQQVQWETERLTWIPKPETLLHADRAADAVATDPLLMKHFPEGWTMPPHQMFFYETDKAEHIKEDQLAEFLSEMPANDIEAFQSGARSIFSPEVLDFHQSRTHAPIAVYGFVGRLIPIALQPTYHEIDFSYESDPEAPKPIKINVQGADDPTVSFTVTMVPLLMDSLLSTTTPEQPFGKLLVYELPRPGRTYGFGVDTAAGIGQDRTVIEGYRKGSMGVSRNFQVCEFASPYINAIDLVPILMAVGTWYSPAYGGERSQAKMVIEMAENGEATQFEMKKRGWSNFHEWLRYDSKIVKSSSARKLGWMTRGWSRSLMLDYLVKALKDDWLVIASPWFVEEMRDLKKDDGDSKVEAASGSFDDRIMAMAMVNISMWDRELYAGPVDTRMREFREPQKVYPLLTIPRPTGDRYGDPADFVNGDSLRDAEDEREMIYEYD